MGIVNDKIIHQKLTVLLKALIAAVIKPEIAGHQERLRGKHADILSVKLRYTDKVTLSIRLLH